MTTNSTVMITIGKIVSEIDLVLKFQTAGIEIRLNGHFDSPGTLLVSAGE